MTTLQYNYGISITQPIPCSNSLDLLFHSVSSADTNKKIITEHRITNSSVKKSKSKSKRKKSTSKKYSRRKSLSKKLIKKRNTIPKKKYVMNNPGMN